MIEHIDDPHQFVARAAAIADAKTAAPQALEFNGRLDGSAGASLKMRVLFGTSASGTTVLWINGAGHSVRESAPTSGPDLKRWLESFFEQWRMQHGAPPAAPQKPREIMCPGVNDAAPPRRRGGSQLSLF